MAAEYGEMTPWEQQRSEINELILRSSEDKTTKWQTHAGAMYLVPENSNVNLSPFAAQHLFTAFGAALAVALVIPTAGVLTFWLAYIFSNILHRVKFERDTVLLKATRFKGVDNNTMRLMAMDMNAFRGNRMAYQHALNGYLSSAYIQVNPRMLNSGMGKMNMGNATLSPSKAVNPMEFLRSFKEGALAGMGTPLGTMARETASSMPFLEGDSTAFSSRERQNSDGGRGITPLNSSIATDAGLLSALVREDEHYGALERLYTSRERLTQEQVLMVESCIKEARASYAILLEAREAASLAHSPDLARAEEDAFKEFSSIIFHATDTISSQVSRERLERMMSANSYMRDKFKDPGDLTL